MPHSIFLGSALATQDRVSITIKSAPSSQERRTYKTAVHAFLRKFTITKASVSRLFHMSPLKEGSADPRSHEEHENNTLGFVKAHIYHGIVDMAISLLGFAVLINAL